MLNVFSPDEANLLQSSLPGGYLFLLGPNGVGKGTQGKALVGKIPGVNVRYLSVGEEFRDLIKQNGDAAQEINGYLDRCELVPLSILTREIICPFLRSLASRDLAVIDGCPRRDDQVDGVMSLLPEQSLKLAFVFRASDPTCISRLVHGARGRKDDKLPDIKKRLAEYRRNFPAVSRELAKAKVPKLYVDSDNLLPDEVGPRFLDALLWGCRAVTGMKTYREPFSHDLPLFAQVG
ncbi:MAG: nucleoside monophosphate kinase [Candidatus Pacebacteria bacterium]|nr:nucleoside monophosphate kinase [Candidatus Paceibacterota bacterium]